jgi:hypothetical protein
MHGTRAANWASDLRLVELRPVERLVDDPANGAGAAAALGAAAQAAIDVARRSARGRAGGGPHLMVAQHVAGAHNHRKTSLAHMYYAIFVNRCIAPSQNKTAL